MMKHRWITIFLILLFLTPAIRGEKKPAGPKVTDKPQDTQAPASCACKQEQSDAEQSRHRLLGCIAGMKREYPGMYYESNLDVFYRKCFASHIPYIQSSVRCEQRCGGRKACTDEFNLQKKDLNGTVEVSLDDHAGYAFATEMKKLLAQKLAGLGRMCLTK